MKLITIISSKKIEFIPLIYHFLENITEHILVFDQAKEESSIANELRLSIEKLNQKYGFSTAIRMVEIDEDSKKDMQEIATSFFKESEMLYLNGAGADTALFTVLSSIVLQHNGKVLAYDKEDNSYNIITQKGFLNEKIEKNMNIEDFLLLMGEEICEEIDKKEIEANKEVLNKLFTDTKRMFRIRFLLKQGKTKELQTSYPSFLDTLKRLKIIDENHRIKGQEGFTRFGYLFEQFIYLQLDAFSFDDIKVGVQICFDKGEREQCALDIINEFDILTIYENRIGFIECKLGDSLDPLGTIYKSDSIMEYFGESARSLIVNIERNKTPHLKKVKKNFGDTILFRAKTKKVSVYNTFDFGKNTFRSKIKEAFDVELKEKIKSEN